jgi:hypothetical protein
MTTDVDASQANTLHLDSIFEAPESVPLSPSAGKHEQPAPTWNDILVKHWREVEARHAGGGRDRETVCAWNTHKAARRVAKGRKGRDFYLHVLSAGYSAARDKWDKLHSSLDPAKAYDPARDNGGGIDAAIFTAAAGAMRNAAAEMSNAFNKRKHHAGQVLPTAGSFDESLPKHGGFGSTGVTTVRDSETLRYSDADGGGTTDKAMNSAADRAARGTSQKIPKSWAPARVKVPSSVSPGERQTFEARRAQELYVAELLEPLPPEERAIIVQCWGVDGAERVAEEELAERMGCSVATVRKRLTKLYAEIRSRSSRNRVAAGGSSE